MAGSTKQARVKKLPVVLTRDEVNRLLKQPNRRAPTGLRNYVMLAIMARAGLRVSELLALQAKHIDFEGEQIRVFDGKGGVDRTVPVEPWVIDAIKSWMTKREELRTKPKWMGTKNGPLFVTLRGQPLGDRYIREMVKRESQQAGIEKDVHPHTLRHSYASHLLKAGYNLEEVRRALGHAYLVTTQVYLHVEPSEFAAKIREKGF